MKIEWVGMQNIKDYSWDSQLTPAVPVVRVDALITSIGRASLKMSVQISVCQFTKLDLCLFVFHNSVLCHG